MWHPVNDSYTFQGGSRIRVHIDAEGIGIGVTEAAIRQYVTANTTINVARVSQSFLGGFTVDGSTLDTVQAEWLRRDIDNALDLMRQSWTIAVAGTLKAGDISAWTTSAWDIIPEITTQQSIGLVALVILAGIGLYVAWQTGALKR